VAAIQASDDGIALTDAAGPFLFMNSAHAAMFGYPDPAALVGRPWTMLYDPLEAQRINDEAMPILFAQGQWRGLGKFSCHRKCCLVSMPCTDHPVEQSPSHCRLGINRCAEKHQFFGTPRAYSSRQSLGTASTWYESSKRLGECKSCGVASN
jgi:hypothetical protein